MLDHQGRFLLPLLFGTFRNPARHMATGFYSGANGRVVDMLLFRDVYRPLSPGKAGSSRELIMEPRV